MYNKTNYSPTQAVIDLNALSYNFKKVKGIVGKKVKILATVKADAYGHGIIPISKRLTSLGVDLLGIASIDEAIVLRNNEIKCPILVLGSILPHQAKCILDYNLRQTVCNMEVAKSLNKLASKFKRKAVVHIKVDTGMGRLGVLHKFAYDFIQKVSKLKAIKIEGVFTHFPKADTDKTFTNYQLRLFNALIKELGDANINIPYFHAANSMGIIAYNKSHFNLVRPGLMLYGISPKKDINLRLKQLITLKTKVVYLKKVPSGFGVGYDHIFVARRPTLLAILPIGYADGYPRSLSNKAQAIIKNRRVNVVGRISMDQITVDVTDIPKVKLGDTVLLIGKTKKDTISVQELARLAGTIPYEIICGIGNRVIRKYIYGSL